SVPTEAFFSRTLWPQQPPAGSSALRSRSPHASEALSSRLRLRPFPSSCSAPAGSPTTLTIASLRHGRSPSLPLFRAKSSRSPPRLPSSVHSSVGGSLDPTALTSSLLPTPSHRTNSAHLTIFHL